VEGGIPPDIIRKPCHREARYTVTITLNGERHEITEPMTVDALLAALEIDPRRVAVEHNRVIVRRPKYGEIVVDEGDTVEIVNFVGGG
jgi:sulfur carrier protein